MAEVFPQFQIPLASSGIQCYNSVTMGTEQEVPVREERAEGFRDAVIEFLRR
jgi:hypothetical protein